MLAAVIIIAIVASCFFVYASYNINSGVYLKTLCKANTSEKVVALTFDDGPDAEQTAKVLDVLFEFNVKACFFCIGKNIKGNELLIKRIINEGHLIGNHSYNHNFSFTLQSAKKVQSDLQKCEETIKETGNIKARLFRPPFGVTNPMIAQVSKQMNYTNIGWSIRSLDTCNAMDKTLDRIKNKLHEGAIILLHDPLPMSDQLVRNLLIHLRENDYRVERLDTLLNLKN